ncbi:MAG TPA: zinc-dependent metalloprotease [Solirubrobacteraceae bacterium]|nr:zinc-dependent metalloprotease [Solirubrobacteraceae bacterium]
MIDWALTERIAGMVAGEAGAGQPRPELAEVSARSERVVSEYTGLRPPAPLPAPELVARPDWVRANLRSMRPTLEPVTARLGEGMGPAAPAVRAVAGVLLAAEMGVIIGYLARRVLGQYELVILDADAPPRLLFVGPNLDDAARSFGADDAEMLRWVALHEVTHALQFAGVPWLRGHLAGLLRELLGSMEVSLDAARLLRVPTREDLRALVDAVSEGDLISLVSTPAQRALLDRMQATMAVLEGYAEHVMDAAGPEMVPSLPKLRAAMDRRRASPSAPARLIQRLLGLEMKMRQYQLGKAFCDAVVARGGIAALNRVWESPDAMPTLAEIEDPPAWMRRTGVRLTASP